MKEKEAQRIGRRGMGWEDDDEEDSVVKNDWGPHVGIRSFARLLYHLLLRSLMFDRNPFSLSLYSSVIEPSHQFTNSSLATPLWITITRK